MNEHLMHAQTDMHIILPKYLHCKHKYNFQNIRELGISISTTNISSQITQFFIIKKGKAAGLLSKLRV